MSLVTAPEADLKSTIESEFKATRFKRKLVDGVAVWVLLLCAALVLLPLFSILAQVLSQGLTSLNVAFFMNLPKPVNETGGGMANAITGSLVLLAIAAGVGVPIGLGTGVYLSEYADRRFAMVVRFVTDVMNGIPSIVYGIFAYTIFVVPLKSFSAVSGGMALGIMMIPIVARTSEEFIRMVPQSLREAGLALGVPRWRVVTDIVLASARGGIVTGIMIALARVAGETAPLLFTAFGNRYWHQNLFQPIAALPLQIYSYAISPFDDWHRQAWAGALTLIGIVFAANLVASHYVRQAKALRKR